ncbi:hypothetical protein [Paraburkholderia gardini]|uniref:hypothetical protein n=1 Tax=Paraburkholderia gardini TaxID=2823469 RepID=UPI001D4243E9|nr:hypothetical protein [Paraburkholderia gardini]CAG4895807.1 hypothetical protein R69919_02072 [Paraburkholderia gardini]
MPFVVRMPEQGNARELKQNEAPRLTMKPLRPNVKINIKMNCADEPWSNALNEGFK